MLHFSVLLVDEALPASVTVLEMTYELFSALEIKCPLALELATLELSAVGNPFA